MLKIRFLRTGKKNQSFFRIVVTDVKRPPKGGRFIEVLGFYSPLTKEKNIKKARIEYWLSQGAKTSDTCHNLLIKEGIIKGTKTSVHKKTKKKQAEVKTKKQEVVKEKEELVGEKQEISDEKKAKKDKVEEPAKVQEKVIIGKPETKKEQKISFDISALKYYTYLVTVAFQFFGSVLEKNH